MRASLFQHGLGPRVLVAVLYAVLAAAAVAWLEPSADGGRTRAALPHGETTGAAPAVICIESVRPAAAWEVRVDGRVIEPRRAEANLWLGEAALDANSALVVDAQPAGGPAGVNSLRIRIAGTTPSRDHVLWCGRDWSAALTIATLARSTAPIDPAELP